MVVAIAMLMVAVAARAESLGQVCDVRAFGAKGDGVTKDTTAIQSAIDSCAGKSGVAGGGTVRLTAGTYLSAPIVLKSGTTLKLEKGATLLGSQDMKDYPAMTEFRTPGLQALVCATNATDVTITERERLMARASRGGRRRGRLRMRV